MTIKERKLEWIAILINKGEIFVFVEILKMLLT